MAWASQKGDLWELQNGLIPHAVKSNDNDTLIRPKNTKESFFFLSIYQKFSAVLIYQMQESWEQKHFQAW